MLKIFEDVALERERQIEKKGYTPDHDHWSMPRDMVRYANWRFTSSPLQVNWFNRSSFIQSIAVLVAAVETMDRQEAIRNSEANT